MKREIADCRLLIADWLVIEGVRDSGHNSRADVVVSTVHNVIVMNQKAEALKKRT